MPRACSVCSHPKHAQIDQELVSLARVADVAVKFKIGDSSIRRHVRSHLAGSLLRDLRASASLGSVDLLERLAESLDDVTAVRSAALLSGNSALVIRSAMATDALVRTLSERLGSDNDLETIRLLRDQETFVGAVAMAIKTDPGLAAPIVSELIRAGRRDLAAEITELATASAARLVETK